MYNLLFVFTDEQAVNTMKAYGNDRIHTPNMNKLAEESLIFKNAYVTQPVCTPSRSTIMTGLYPHTNGCIENNIPLPVEIPCLPELADFSGYKTAYIGKWHLGDEVFPQHGFETWKSIEDEYRKYYSKGRNKNQHSSYHDFLVENGFKPDRKETDGFEYFSRAFCTKLPEEFSKPAYVAMEASHFIRENKDVPFIMYVNFLEPHMPFTGPRDYQYDPSQVLLPPNFDHELGDDINLKSRLFRMGYYERGHSKLPLKTEDDWRRIIANYWGLVSLVDTYLGKILDTLRECGLYDNTIIVYTSDHGDMMGSHRLIAKCVMFEEAIKVPLLFKIPGMDCRNKVIDDPVSQVDLVPTLLEILGKTTDKRLDGFSWMPFLKGKGELKQKDVFIQWNGYNNGFGDVTGGARLLDTWKEKYSEETILRAIGDPVCTVITPDGWKYCKSRWGEDELYNLKEDPYELENLVGDNAYRDLICALSSKITEWCYTCSKV